MTDEQWNLGEFIRYESKKQSLIRKIRNYLLGIKYMIEDLIEKYKQK